MASLFGSLRTSASEDIAIAIVDYTPSDSKSGFAFKKGDRFLIKANSDSNWWKAKREDDPSISDKVPSNLVVKVGDFDNLKWITFNTDRPTVENELSNAKYPVGSFCIRSKVEHINHKNHSLVLSVKAERAGRFMHYLLPKIGNQFRVGVDGTLFDSLTHLVHHYAGRRKNAALVLTFAVQKNESVVPWEYDEREVIVGEKLDGGHFGTVHLGRLNGELVALKTPKIIDEDEFMKEADIARPYKHPNVLETIGICRIGERVFIITEYLENGSLKKFLRIHELTPTECLSVTQKIASAMEYLHSLKMVHRDLAARNILVGATIHDIKVCDFGLARSLQDSRYYITRKETFPHRWTAPEGFVFFNGFVPTEPGTITSAADVWSFAVVLWEIFSNGMEPYHNLEDKGPVRLHKFLKEENQRLEQPDKCPDAIYAKMLECWNIDRKARPTFAGLQPFLVSMKIDEPVSPPAAVLMNSDTDCDSSSMETTSSGGGYNQIPYEVVEEASQDDQELDKVTINMEVERKASPVLMVLSSPDSALGDELMRPTSFNFQL